jgi:hypothetical protein
VLLTIYEHVDIDVAKFRRADHPIHGQVPPGMVCTLSGVNALAPPYLRWSTTGVQARILQMHTGGRIALEDGCHAVGNSVKIINCAS